MEIKHIT